MRIHPNTHCFIANTNFMNIRLRNTINLFHIYPILTYIARVYLEAYR